MVTDIAEIGLVLFFLMGQPLKNEFSFCFLSNVRVMADLGPGTMLGHYGEKRYPPFIPNAGWSVLIS